MQCQTAGNACGRDGTCDGNGACRLAAQGVTCGQSTCTQSALTAAARCSGAGACIPPQGANACLNNYACASSTACATSCSEDSTTGCALGFECRNGLCVQATVPCGGPACPVANNGGMCCATNPDSMGRASTFTCLPPGATCTGSPIVCNSRSDCAAGQYCCLLGNGCGPAAWDTRCVNDLSACVDGSMSFGRQVCDHDSECSSGACLAPGDLCRPGLSVCLR